MKIAIIPARGGSKRIPRKNIRNFAGEPMIFYAIDAAKQARLFDHIVVSTDDDEITDIARGLGAEVPFRRPAELADDHMPTVPVIAHAVDACRNLGWDVGAVCCIYPAVPLIDPADIGSAYDLLEAGDGEGYVFPVTPFPSPVQRALRLNAQGTISSFFAGHITTRTQDLEPAYHDAGQFYWGQADTWRAGLEIHDNGRAVVLPEWRVVDIDTPEDWDRAELVYAAMRNRQGS